MNKSHLDPIMQEQIKENGLRQLLVQQGELFGVQSVTAYLMPQIDEFESINNVLVSRLSDGRIHPADLEAAKKGLESKYKSMLNTIDTGIAANDKAIEDTTNAMKAEITRNVASDFALTPLLAKFVSDKKQLIELAAKDKAYGRLAVGAVGRVYGITEDDHTTIIQAALPEQTAEIEMMFSKNQALLKMKKLVEQSIGEVVDLLLPKEKAVEFLGVQVTEGQ